jgi:hypothetical protein
MEIRTQTGQVMFESEYRAYLLANNGPSFETLTPEIMAELGIDPVLEGPQATTTPPYQFSQRSGVEQIGEQWFTKYIAGPVFTDRAATETEAAQTAAEQEAAYKAQKDAEQATSVRTDRTKRLADSDWTQIADSTADKAAWATYRTALRDISAQAGFPWTIEWPTQP